MAGSPVSLHRLPSHEPGGDLDQKRQTEARALIESLSFDAVSEPLKVAIMVRVHRVFNVDITSESFCCMLHIVTCWLAEGDASNDAVSDAEVSGLLQLHGDHDAHVQRDVESRLTFVYDADPDKAFCEHDKAF
jgi:hypothetical protein